MDGDIVLGALALGLAALSADAARGVGRIRVFAEVGGMRNPDRLVDENGRAMLLGSVSPGSYDAVFRTVIYHGSGSEVPISMLLVFDERRGTNGMWVGKSVRQWEGDHVKWLW